MEVLKTPQARRQVPDIDLPGQVRGFFDNAFERVTSAPLRTNNSVRLLRDATENYPRWFEAIEGAEKYIYFESYIIHDDEQGEKLASALIEKVKQGVEVKLIYDWLGGFGTTSRSYWRRLRDGGVDVRVYNPPSLYDPFGVFSRDHRKSMVVDGRIGFVSGLCVGQDWVGHPEKNIPPWRDTGVEIAGTAVKDIEQAFASVWQTTGEPLIPHEAGEAKDSDPQGNVALRVVQSAPGRAHVYRVDQILAASAQETMWLTDAYFVGIPSYLQSLKDAAMDGVDVRMLVPQSTDLGLIRDTTRSMYRPLLEAGVRVFEWSGPMMHAKTAVFDGRYSRVGSTNLNISSWFGNYELDVLVEDEGFGSEMEEMFLRDLESSTEIVLSDTVRKRRIGPRPKRTRRAGGSMRKAAAGALTAASSIGSVIAGQSPLGAAESRLLTIIGTTLLLFAFLLYWFPRGTTYPIIVLLLLFAIPTLINAIQNYRKNG